MWTVVVLIISVVWGQVAVATQSHTDTYSSYESINTEDDGNYKVSRYDYSGQAYVKLRVKACKDVHINLMADRDLDDRSNTYIIIVGGMGNTKSEILKGENTDAKTYRNGAFLNCDQFIWLFVSWGPTGYIRVYTTHKWIMTWRDPNPYKVEAVSVSTGSMASGMWDVYNPETRSACCYSGGNAYCILPDTNCQRFTQQDVHQKPPGITYLQSACYFPILKFNIRNCICDHTRNVPYCPKP